MKIVIKGHNRDRELSYTTHNGLPFLPGRTKIKKRQKLVSNLHNKEKYVLRIRHLKQALYHELILNMHRIIKFNKKAWQKPYIDLNARLRTEAKYNFKKYFFKLMNNSVF